MRAANPCRRLPKSVLRLMRSDHDPKPTAFVERLADVRRIFLALEEPLNVAFAIGKSLLGGFNFVFGGRVEYTSVHSHRDLEDGDHRQTVLDQLAQICEAGGRLLFGDLLPLFNLRSGKEPLTPAAAWCRWSALALLSIPAVPLLVGGLWVGAVRIPLGRSFALITAGMVVRILITFAAP